MWVPFPPAPAALMCIEAEVQPWAIELAMVQFSAHNLAASVAVAMAAAASSAPAPPPAEAAAAAAVVTKSASKLGQPLWPMLDYPAPASASLAAASHCMGCVTAAA